MDKKELGIAMDKLSNAMKGKRFSPKRFVLGKYPNATYDPQGRRVYSIFGGGTVLGTAKPGARLQEHSAWKNAAKNLGYRQT